MKAIFLNEFFIPGIEMTKRVYDEAARAALAAEAGLGKTTFTKADVLARPEEFKDTKYIFTTWGMPQFTVEEIKTYLPSLEAVFYGEGTVKMFAEPFMDAGVKIFSAWGANAIPVAEYTVAQIVLANKGFFLSCRRSRSAEQFKALRGYSMSMAGNYGARVGVIGAGMIGKLVIQGLKAYELKVLVYDPFLSEEKAAELGVERASLEEIFSTCQTITNHVANLPETVGMLNYGLFSKMLPTATFLNTGRGAQVVEADLIRALKEQPNRAAVLDVTFPEPPEADSELYTLENVFLTPHIAGSLMLGDEVARMGLYMLGEFRSYAKGEPCRYEVRREMLSTMA